MGVILTSSDDAHTEHPRLTAPDGDGGELREKILSFLRSEKNRVRRESSRKLIEAAQKKGVVANAFQSDIRGDLRVRVSDEMYPDRVILTKGGQLFDYDPACDAGLVVSQKFRDLTEEFDPGVHQFVPVAVENYNGQPLGAHYFCRILRPVNAIRTVGSNLELVARDSGRGDLADLHVNSSSEFSVHADRIEGFGAWREMRSTSRSCFSDALWRRMVDEGLTGATPWVRFGEY